MIKYCIQTYLLRFCIESIEEKAGWFIHIKRDKLDTQRRRAWNIYWRFEDRKGFSKSALRETLGFAF